MKEVLIVCLAAAAILTVGLYLDWAPLIGLGGGILIVVGGIFACFYLPFRGQHNSWPT